MQDAYVNINNIPTHIYTWGKWIEESLGDTQEVVICITGNPGLPGFYTQFLSTIHSDLGPDIPVWVIGQAGHDDPPSRSLRTVPPLSGNEQLFDTNGQIKHKIDFIESYVPKGVKIHLIGHSIGAWMILQLLKQPQIKGRIKKCYLLFPTIEHMEKSPNGKIFSYAVWPILFIIKYLLEFITLLPISFRVFLIYVYFWIFAIPRVFLKTTIRYIKPSVVEKVCYLAKCEMDQVKELEVDLIKENKNLLKFYYGASDGWVPLKYYENLKQQIPDIDASVDNKNILHAFVLRSSTEMGHIVSDWIKTNIVL